MQAVIVAGTLLTAVSALQQGAYQRKVADYNARVLENQKVAIKQKAELDVEQHKDKVKRLKASQRVAYLKSGVSLSGSALDVISETEQQGLLDEKIIRYNAAQGIQGTEAEIALTLAGGEQAMRAGQLQAGASLLAGAGKFAKSRLQ